MSSPYADLGTRHLKPTRARLSRVRAALSKHHEPLPAWAWLSEQNLIPKLWVGTKKDRFADLRECRKCHGTSYENVAEDGAAGRDSVRVFCSACNAAGKERVFSAAPPTLGLCLALAADIVGVSLAESYAIELHTVLHKSEPTRVLWVDNLEAFHGRWHQGWAPELPWSLRRSQQELPLALDRRLEELFPGDQRKSDACQDLVSAISWDALDVPPIPVGDALFAFKPTNPVPLMLEILLLGYVVADVELGTVFLYAPPCA